jgi:hypothetical protein
MKFEIKRASDGLVPDTIETVDISSIDELQAIAEKYKGINPKNSNSWTGKHTLIVDFESHIITIYDDYVE